MWFGGTINAAANGSTEFDPRTRRIRVLGQEFEAPGRDTTLVLLVDRVDHIGGEPVITTLLVPMSVREDLVSAAMHGRGDTAYAMMHADDYWNEQLLAHPVIAAFTR